MKNLKRIVLVLALTAMSALLWAGPASLTGSVKLAWNASPSTNVASYVIYYGTASRTYTQSTNVGNVLEVTIPNLTRGVKLYFTATAKSTDGLESDYCNEVSYTPPTIPAPPTGLEIK